MAHIVIVSQEKPLAQALSDIISRELNAMVTTAENPAILSQMPDIDLVIATEPVNTPSPWRLMPLQLGEPRRIGAILSEIALHLADKPYIPLLLAESIALHDKSRKLERLDTGTILELTEKELALLLFIKSEGEVGRDDILKNVWGFSEGVTTHTLDTHLYRLRQKWRELADYDCIIATDGGYRWYEHSS